VGGESYGRDRFYGGGVVVPVVVAPESKCVIGGGGCSTGSDCSIPE
jgi:hypothetical protein